MAVSCSATNSSYFSATTSELPNCEAAKTICLRVNITTLSGTQMLFTATNGSSVSYQLGIYLNTLRLWNYAGGGTPLISFTPTLNAWISIIYSFNPLTSTSTIYQNGVLMNTSTLAPNTGAVSMAQVFGDQWSEYAVSCLAEDLRIYNRVLSGPEIIDLSNTQGFSQNEYGLVAWWPMNNLQNGVVLTALNESHNISSTLVGTSGGITGASTVLTTPKSIAI